MLDSFCAILKSLTIHLFYHWFIFMSSSCPRKLRLKSNQSQWLEATPLKVLYFCLVSRYQWEDGA